MPFREREREFPTQRAKNASLIADFTTPALTNIVYNISRIQIQAVRSKWIDASNSSKKLLKAAVVQACYKNNP